MGDDRAWLHLKDVYQQYGYGSASAAYNAVAAGHFPVPTYKLARYIVIDKAVHSEFFEKHRREGLATLRANMEKT